MKDLETKFGSEHDGKSMHDYFDPIVTIRNEVRIGFARIDLISSAYVPVGIASDKKGDYIEKYYLAAQLFALKTFIGRFPPGMGYYPGYYPTRLFFFPAYNTSNCNE
jgi:hypothetical protein